MSTEAAPRAPLLTADPNRWAIKVYEAGDMYICRTCSAGIAVYVNDSKAERERVQRDEIDGHVCEPRTCAGRD